MKKEYRVRKSEEFNQIIHLRQSYANASFVLYYRDNDDHMHVGISASKKLGNAVVRNKIKRQVRMMVHELFNEQDQKDYIIIVRNKYLYNDYSTNKGNLLSLYKKVNKRS